MNRWLPTLLALAALSCGGSDIDRETLRAEIRAEMERERAEHERAMARRNVSPTPAVDLGDHERIRMPATGAPARGAAEPLVTIVELADFECPFCARVQPTLARLLREHPEVGLRFRHNPLPFHPNAALAAEAAVEAYEQGGDRLFWSFHDLLFENQHALSRGDLEGYAAALGMDLARFRQALDQRTHQARVQADQSIAARSTARGTPGFFINGRMLMGAQPYDRFEAIVLEELAIARRAIEHGTPPADVYATLQRGALDQPTPSDDEPGNPPRPQPDPDAIYRVPIDGRPTLGRADALVTIVESGEFQCPFCSRVRPTLAQIRQRYGADVRVVWFHNPLQFHPNARPAAHAAQEVFEQRGSQAFFRYGELLFDNQRDLTTDTLVRLADQVGANGRQVRRAIETQRHDARIREDQELMRSLGAVGTPSFFINGRSVRGAQPWPVFEAVIDEVLADARARVSRGTPRDRLYAEIIANGATSQQLVGPAEEAGGGAAPPDPRYAIAVPPRAPSRGPADAPVTLQVFSDFQCPFCSRVWPTIDQIVDRYGHQVRVVYRDYPLPFHQRAMPASEAAREVFAQGGSDAFWRYHGLLYANQRELEDDDLVRFARQVPGIDARAVRRALADHRHRAAVQADMQAVQDAGARIGTPSTFINGRLLQGAQPLRAFTAAIDEALGR